MALDIRILRNCNIRMGTMFWRQILALFQVVIILSESVGSPVWMPQFLSGGQGRSIRHLPCVSRRTGEQGICMFAYTCLKSNGTHLGTCIDRFYFGSCCKLEDANDLLVDSHFPVISNNQVTLANGPSDGNTQSVSVQSEMNKITQTLFPTSSKLNYPTTTQKVETTTGAMNLQGTAFDSTDKTIVDLAQHLATETYFVTQNTDKFYVPVHTSKPNRTEVIGSASNSYSTVMPSSGPYGGIRKPTTVAYDVAESTSTTSPSYFLSTFQVVHNQVSSTGQVPAKGTSAPPATTVRTTSKLPTTATLVTSDLLSTWTPLKQNVTLPSAIKKNSTESSLRPTPTTTTKKPAKPTKPYATTRKPQTKRPTVKPTATSAKPTVVKISTTKPTLPTKKPATSKPFAKPSTGSSTAPYAGTSPKPTTTGQKTTAKPTAGNATTASRYPVFTTYVDTTSEVVFTKPGSAAPQTPGYGITTFRPDLGGVTTKPGPATGSGLTTFSYVSEGVRETTPRPTEITTIRSKPTRPGENSSELPTVSNEISSSQWTGSPGGSSELHEENTNLIFQQAGSTLRPASQTAATSSKPSESSVPFFPEAEKPGSPTQWIEMIQTSMKPELPSSLPTSAVTASPVHPSTVATIFQGLNQSDYTQVCGRRIYPQARVVGGEKSTFGKWPWQISLRQWRTSTYLHKCGAALLNENWAITAAHCVENVPPSDLLLRLGEHDLSTEEEPFGFQERRVQIVASHPQFDPRTFEYDLALLRFYEPVKFQPNIIPVCVPEDNTNFVGQTAYVTGWGRLYEDGPLPSVLQEVSVPVINNTLCENMYRSAGYIEHIPEIFICAGWKKGGFDSCEGDSGGPMVIQRPDKRWLLAGVISWGIGCAEPNQPGVYTRISEFREWIHQILQF